MASSRGRMDCKFLARRGRRRERVADSRGASDRDSAGGLDFDFGALETSLGMGAGGNGVEVPFSAP